MGKKKKEEENKWVKYRFQIAVYQTKRVYILQSFKNLFRDFFESLHREIRLGIVVSNIFTKIIQIFSNNKILKLIYLIK